MAFEEATIAVGSLGQVLGPAFGPGEPRQLLAAQSGGANGIELDHAAPRNGIGRRPARREGTEQSVAAENEAGEFRPGRGHHGRLRRQPANPPDPAQGPAEAALVKSSESLDLRPARSPYTRSR